MDPVPQTTPTKPARVLLSATTKIPRENTRGELFFSCFAPIRGKRGFDTVNFVVNSEEELQEVLDIGLIELSEITTKEEDYIDKEGVTRQELTTTLGFIRARGDW